MTKVKNLIVFIRGHNDFDHILPILDYLINYKSKEVCVTIYTHLYVDDKCKKHIDYCENILKNKTISFNTIHFNSMDRFLLKVIKVLNKNSHPNLFFINMLVTNLRRLFQTIASLSVKKFIYNLSDGTVILADFGTENQFPYNYFIKYSNIFNVPIISYLHGYYIFDNINAINTQTPKLPKHFVNLINKYLFGKKDREYYDKYLVGPCQKNKYFRSDLYSNFNKTSRVIEIGIPRFTYEWVNKFTDNKPKVEKEIGNLKVALFVSNIKFGVDIDSLNNMISKLCLTNGVDLKIVPHTRSGITNIKEHMSFVTKKTSSEVINWADVGIIYGTSIAFEMLIKEVVVIVPKFISHNTTIFEVKGVCIEPESVEELIKYVSDLVLANNIKIKDVNAFINKYVYGDCDTYKKLMERFYYHIVNT